MAAVSTKTAGFSVNSSRSFDKSDLAELQEEVGAEQLVFTQSSLSCYSWVDHILLLQPFLLYLLTFLVIYYTHTHSRICCRIQSVYILCVRLNIKTCYKVAVGS